MPMSPLDQLRVVSTVASAASARVYVQLPRADDDALAIKGTLTGPFCRGHHTLTARMPLVDRGPGPTVLAEGVVVDPCPWTPDEPFLYQLDVELWRGSERVAEARRTVGLRGIELRGGWLRRQGKPWVPRCVPYAWGDTHDWSEWRAAAAVAIVRSPSDELLHAATEYGVALVVESDRADTETLVRLAECPAVAIVVLSRDALLDEDARTVARRLILAGRSTPEAPGQPAAWEQLAWCVFDRADELAARRGAWPASLPLVGAQRLVESLDLTAARAACDHAQGLLAGHVQCAGFAVV
ncbi:MAG: hypothetical protein JSS27_09035 [Planctomycetes bacterium]|nr:hypothetical protein [Planctomycetota bacterium]